MTLLVAFMAVFFCVWSLIGGFLVGDFPGSDSTGPSPIVGVVDVDLTFVSVGTYVTGLYDQDSDA
jgi:hypothetical protein